MRGLPEELGPLWPAVKGCVVEVRKPCIRVNCKACATGEKHASFMFTFMREGRQRCMYVPRELVPKLREAIDNGRRLEQRMILMGVEMIQKHREDRKRGQLKKS